MVSGIEEIGWKTIPRRQMTRNKETELAGYRDGTGKHAGLFIQNRAFMLGRNSRNICKVDKGH